MRRDLLRRVARLEARSGLSERRLLLLADRLQIDPQRLLAAFQGQEAQLARQLSDDGCITWEGYLLVLKALGILPPGAGRITLTQPQ